MTTDMMTLHSLISDASPAKEMFDDASLKGLREMIEHVGFIDDNFLRCWKNTCQLDPSEKHVSAVMVVSLLARYETPLDRRPVSQSDSQHADIQVTRHWIRNMLWTLASGHGFVSASAPDVELRPEYAMRIAADAIEACSKYDICSLETHGVGLVEKLYDVATTCARVAQSFPVSIDVLTCFDHSDTA